MMKKLLLFSAAVFIAFSAFSQFIEYRISDHVFARHYGKDYDGFTNAVARIGSLKRTLVVDGGGEWVLTNSVTIPTNINLLVTADTMINVATSRVLTINGFISSGDWQTFSGDGVVTGPCANPFVFDDWTVTNVEYLGTPYSQIPTNSFAWWTNYIGVQDEYYLTLATNWVVLNYVAGSDMTNYVTNALSDYMTGLAITNELSNYVSQVGGTAQAVIVISTNIGMPRVKVTITGDPIGTFISNDWNRIEITNDATGKIGGWTPGTHTWQAPWVGMYHVHADLNYGLGGGVEDMEVWWAKNAIVGNPAVGQRHGVKIGDYDPAVFGDSNVRFNGGSHFYVTAAGVVGSTNYWSLSHFSDESIGDKTGSVAVGGSFEIIYLGDPAKFE